MLIRKIQTIRSKSRLSYYCLPKTRGPQKILFSAGAILLTQAFSVQKMTLILTHTIHPVTHGGDGPRCRAAPQINPQPSDWWTMKPSTETCPRMVYSRRRGTNACGRQSSPGPHPSWCTAVHVKPGSQVVDRRASGYALVKQEVKWCWPQAACRAEWPFLSCKKGQRGDGHHHHSIEGDEPGGWERDGKKAIQRKRNLLGSQPPEGSGWHWRVSLLRCRPAGLAGLQLTLNQGPSPTHRA